MPTNTPYPNAERPQLLQYPSVIDLPLAALGPELCSNLEKSLAVSPSDGPVCAASARLWESLLEDHRLPFLLLRVGDMRMSLGSKVTAMALYEEVYSQLSGVLDDSDFEDWVKHSRIKILTDAHRQLLVYKTDLSLGFSPSQRWRPTARDAFPYCKLQRAQIAAMRKLWTSMGDAAVVMAHFLNLHCLETSLMEGAFQFEEKAFSELVRSGFDPMPPLTSKHIVGGEVHSIVDAAGILRDTHKALHEIFEFAEPEPPNLTVEMICRLHRQLMRTSRVLYVDLGSRQKVSYINIGTTRQVSQVNVTASTLSSGRRMKVQFCPYDEINPELDTFCERFNELIRQTDRDPFASAAWISHVFVTIHPFEDGNGRISRILASIPLVRSGLPPLCIQASSKSTYIAHHNSIRADRNGDYQMSMEMFYRETKKSMDLLGVRYMQ